jgi:hypothetical protein
MGLISNLFSVFVLAGFMLGVSAYPAVAAESKALRWLFAGRGVIAMTHPDFSTALNPS